MSKQTKQIKKGICSKSVNLLNFLSISAVKTVTWRKWSEYSLSFWSRHHYFSWFLLIVCVSRTAFFFSFLTLKVLAMFFFCAGTKRGPSSDTKHLLRQSKVSFTHTHFCCLFSFLLVLHICSQSLQRNFAYSQCRVFVSLFIYFGFFIGCNRIFLFLHGSTTFVFGF